MNFQLSQIILIMAILFFVVYIFRVRTVLTDRMIYLLLVFGGVLLVLYPDLSTRFANLIGVGRGADLLLYFFIIFSLFYHVSNNSRLKKVERHLTIVVRKMAIADAASELSYRNDITNNTSADSTIIKEHVRDGDVEHNEGFYQ